MSELGTALAVRADIDRLLARETWCHLLVPQINLNWGVMLSDTGRIVRRLRGRVMPTWLAYETETSAALQFPEIYEQYPNTFDECLADLDWLATDSGFLLFITQPEQLLRQELHHYTDVVAGLAAAADTFAQPITGRGDDDRPALAFDVILVTDHHHHDAVADRWRAAGAPL